MDQDANDKSATSTATPTDKSQGMTKTAQKILKGQTQAPCQTLFLGNLAFNTTEDEIREMFERHDKSSNKGTVKASGELENEKRSIRKVRMGTFEDTGHCKGQVPNLASLKPDSMHPADLGWDFFIQFCLC